MECCGENRLSMKKVDTPNIDYEQINTILKKYKGVPGSLISILQEVQKIYDYLPYDVLNQIATVTGEKLAKIHGVSTFYTQFRFNPIGKNVIMLCQGTACHVNGSKAIENAICDELNIRDLETTEDGLFTINNVACLGCCSLSPVMMINDETFGKLTPDSARDIIREIRNREIAEKEDLK